MSSPKRKRAQDAAPARSPSKAPKTVHRATRHSSNAPLLYKADPEPRRRRTRRSHVAVPDAQPEPEPEVEVSEASDDHAEEVGRLKETSLRGRRPHAHASAHAPAPAPTALTPPSASGRSAPRRPVLQPTNQARPDLALKPAAARSLRHRHDNAQYDDDDDDDDDHDGADADHQTQFDPSPPVQQPHLRRRGSAAPPRAVPPTTPISQQHHHRQQQRQHQHMPSNTRPTASMAQPPSRPARASDRVSANTSKPFLQPPAKSTQRPSPKPARKTQQHPSKEHKKPNTAERNIDKVVFGNICFSTWYHSPYGTDALGGVSGNNVKSANSNGPSSQDRSGKDDGGIGSTASRKTREDRLDRLYVCPCCFKYSKELVPWWQHVHQCERRGYVPGKKIYTHPKVHQAKHAASTGTAQASKGSGRKRKTPDATAQPVEDLVQGQGEWSIWEVDGEEEGLFCQNLSLFAKLFLDNKSVFFDVVGFKYYLLVHTAPRPPHPPTSQDAADEHENVDEETRPLPPKHQIVGFFSKEKLSWDNNNLACILIFPPWQRKGLGALLMGVSYEISRREGVVGGPEKPISDLGKRGYKRFWAGEIAAWLLGLDNPGEGEGGSGEIIVDAEECSRATWIVPEDCLAVLREMGIVEEAGLGPPRPVRRSTSPVEGGGVEELAAVAGGEKKENEVPRVRVSKQAVWDWVRDNGISLEKACDPDGFVDGYAIKTASVEDDDEE